MPPHQLNTIFSQVLKDARFTVIVCTIYFSKQCKPDTFIAANTVQQHEPRGRVQGPVAVDGPREHPLLCCQRFLPATFLNTIVFLFDRWIWGRGDN